jgi:hypothetical protein
MPEHFHQCYYTWAYKVEYGTGKFQNATGTGVRALPLAVARTPTNGREPSRIDPVTVMIGQICSRCETTTAIVA